MLPNILSYSTIVSAAFVSSVAAVTTVTVPSDTASHSIPPLLCEL